MIAKSERLSTWHGWILISVSRIFFKLSVFQVLCCRIKLFGSVVLLESYFIGQLYTAYRINFVG